MKSEAISKKAFSAHHIPYRETGYFSKVVLDYLDEAESLRSFYGLKPELSSFKDQIESKVNFQHRDVLVSALKRQYNNVKNPPNSIEQLGNQKTFTVTTGHQVCLFTGPIYVIFKIVTAINTCKKLKSEYPDLDFVPIFWMATEDHDFEEANHFFIDDKKIEWESGQGGAVGRMKPIGMDEVAESLKESFGMGYHSGELIELFEKAYLNHDNIADATRYLVHSLFGDHGVVCIDGDDRDLKRLAIPIFGKELKENFSYKAVSQTSDRLSENYDLQVHARDINLFYLGEELRERIVRNDDGIFEVLNTRITFSEEEMDASLGDHPDRFSPNVILRPLYQEVILPNLAYIGGGGELAYWFQLKEVFNRAQVEFPILMLRNSAMIAVAKSASLVEKLGLSWRNVFSSTHALEKKLVKDESTMRMNLDLEREKMEAIFLEVESRLSDIEVTLQKSVRSGYARTDRIFANLEKKMIRAEKKKQETLIQRIQRLKMALFPNDGLQERNQNFSVYYVQYGVHFIDLLVDELDPFEKNFTILLERD